MGKQSNRPKNKGGCVYCGVQPWTTRDHVIPKALFPEPLPLEMVTVGSCSACNEAKGLLDSYLRDYLLSDIDTSHNVKASIIRDGEFLRSIQSNRSLLARESTPTISIQPVHTPAGLFLGYAPAMEIDWEIILYLFKYIIICLYFKLRRKRIPEDYIFEVSRINRFPASTAFREDYQLQPRNYRGLGKDIFDFIFSYASEDEFVTRWELVFYNSILIRVETEPPNGVEHLLRRLADNA